ncbi:MAG: recombinase RecA [Candidatus Mycalebacterium zealandia]|nr:MAG: recombinase RecA [Candidatus Mycalebacterium zealandia]
MAKEKVESSKRSDSVEKAISLIEKQFGEGAIMTLGAGGKVPDIQVISTGSIGINIALGIGGLPRGRVVEIYGAESSGKTTIAIGAVAECQKSGGTAAFVDAEHALDPRYAAALGVKLKDLLVSQPDSGEQALEIVDTLVKSGAVDLIVIDSVAALVPKAEIDGEMGDSHVGLQARLMSQALRKLTGNVNKSGTTVLFINQTRQKIGVPAYMNPETTTGGMALRFYSSVRMDIRRVASVKDKNENITGIKARVRVVKNKVAPPFRAAEVEIVYGKGISKFGELLDIGAQYGIVEQKGAHYSYDGKKLGQGRQKSFEFLAENLPVAREIRKKILEKAGVKDS